MCSITHKERCVSYLFWYLIFILNIENFSVIYIFNVKLLIGDRIHIYIYLICR